MKEYNKLVRDKIPNIITSSGKKGVTKTLNDEEFTYQLKLKLIEESREIIAANTKDEMIEALADLYEVLEAILAIEKIDFNEVQKKRKIKNEEKGAFKDKVFLIHVK